MTRAFLTHLLLLMTMRHDGKGLPDRWPGFLLIFALYLVAHSFLLGPSLIAWAGTIGMPIVSRLLTNARLVCGIMLIMTVIIVLTLFVDESHMHYLSLWQMAAMLSFAFRSIWVQIKETEKDEK